MTLVVRDDLNVVMLPDADAPDIVTVRLGTYYASVRIHLRVRCTQINTDRRHFINAAGMGRLLEADGGVAQDLNGDDGCWDDPKMR